MSITREQFDELQESMRKFEIAFDEIQYIVQSADPNLYERWKAYGKHVTNEFMISGPSLPDVIETLEKDIIEDDEEEDDSDCPS